MNGPLARSRPIRGVASKTDAISLLNALPVAVTVLDAGNRFRYANQEAEAFFGLSLSQLLQHALSDLVPEDNPIFSLLDQVRASEATIGDHDLTLESPRLRRHCVTVQATPAPDEPGGVLLALHDASAARALDRHMTVLGAARSASGMAAMLAHEVKNPLSGIRGAAQLLESTVAPADRELAVLIRDEADRIRALVDRMEVFGDKPVERETVNIHHVLDHVRRLAASGFAAGIRISESYDPSLPPVWGNRDQLVQVILNLVKNAAEAIAGAGEGGEITLATAYQHGVRIVRMKQPGSARPLHLPLVVTVRDTGPGIPEGLRPHLFDPFITSKPAGSGLGLALVAKVVSDHGGLVELDSRPGRTEFRLLFPVAPGGAGGRDAR